MTRCAREKEIQSLLTSGHWPQAAAQELRDHVASCRGCGERVLLRTAFRGARAAAVSAARPVAPSAIWWRAQLRRRNAAVDRVARPILGAQIFALAVNLVVLCVLVVWQATQGVHWLSWFAASTASSTPSGSGFWAGLQALSPAALFNPSWTLPVVLPFLAIAAMLGGALVYLATDRG
jgi:hypothetical protein